MRMSSANTEYHNPLGPAEGENERLQANHRMTKLAMGGSIVLAPFDTTRHNLKILDSGTADGEELWG